MRDMSASGLASGAVPMTVFAHGAPAVAWEPNWIDHRASVARVARREESGEEVAQCDECYCELDIQPVAHSPKCSHIAAPVLSVVPDESELTEPAADDEDDDERGDLVGDQSVAEVMCKVTGCSHRARATRGRYARLCAVHIETVKARQQPSRKPLAEQALDDPEPGRGRTAAWSAEEILAAITRWAERYGAPPTANEWTKRVIGYPTCSTVAKRFGSWANGIEAAGFPRPIRGGATSTGQQPPIVWAVKVPTIGLKYRTVDEAYIAAEEIEADGERVADGARHDGNEAKAEQATDAASELARKIRAAAAAADPSSADQSPERDEDPPEPSERDEEPLSAPVDKNAALYQEALAEALYALRGCGREADAKDLERRYGLVFVEPKPQVYAS